MFERDYLVKMMVEFAAAIARSLKRAREEEDYEAASATLENSIAQATDLDGAVLLSLAPESIASVLKVSNTDPRVVVYIAHSMLLQSHYLNKMGNASVAALREKQARALSKEYGFELPDNVDEVDDELFNEEEFLKSIEEMTKP